MELWWIGLIIYVLFRSSTACGANLRRYSMTQKKLRGADQSSRSIYVVWSVTFSVSGALLSIALIFTPQVTPFSHHFPMGAVAQPMLQLQHHRQLYICMWLPTWLPSACPSAYCVGALQTCCRPVAPSFCGQFAVGQVHEQ